MSRVNYIHSEHHLSSTFQWTFENGCDRHEFLRALQSLATKLNLLFAEVDLFTIDPAKPQTLGRAKAYVIGVRPILAPSVSVIIGTHLHDLGLTAMSYSPWRTAMEDLELFTPLI